MLEKTNGEKVRSIVMIVGLIILICGIFGTTYSTYISVTKHIERVDIHQADTQILLTINQLLGIELKPLTLEIVELKITVGSMREEIKSMRENIRNLQVAVLANTRDFSDREVKE